jgi:hypothetical protein
MEDARLEPERAPIVRELLERKAGAASWRDLKRKLPGSFQPLVILNHPSGSYTREHV